MLICDGPMNEQTNHNHLVCERNLSLIGIMIDWLVLSIPPNDINQHRLAIELYYE